MTERSTAERYLEAVGADKVSRMTESSDEDWHRAVPENDVLLQQTEDGHHRFVDAPAEDEYDPRTIARLTMDVGAQVELKSGGPAMTVLEWRRDDMVDVDWFIGGALQRDSFPWQSLKLAGVVLEKRPVAWRDRRTGIIYTIESDAYLACEGNDRGNVEGLYLRDGT